MASPSGMYRVLTMCLPVSWLHRYNCSMTTILFLFLAAWFLAGVLLLVIACGGILSIIRSLRILLN